MVNPPTTIDPSDQLKRRQFTLGNLMLRVTVVCVLLALPREYRFPGLWAALFLLQIWDHGITAIQGFLVGAAFGALIFVALLQDPVWSLSTWTPVLFLGCAGSLFYAAWKDGWFKYRGVW